MKKQTKTPQTGPNFAQSFNVVADLANSYGQFDDGAPKTVKQSNNSPRTAPKAPSSKLNQPSQQGSIFKQTNQTQTRQRSNTPKNRNNVRSNTPKKNLQQTPPKQLQQHQPQQPTIRQETVEIPNQSIFKNIPTNKYLIHEQPKNEKEVIHFLKQFEKNVMMNSFFEEFYRNNLLSQHSNFFTALSNSKVAHNTNDFVVLNCSPQAEKQRMQIDYQNGEDPAFPCTDDAFSWGKRAQSVGWQRPPQGSTIFNHLSPESVVQGRLGDCYLISSISVLADYPNILRRLIKKEAEGIYTVWLCPDGRWKPITVDDRFPTQGSQFMGALPYQGDIGVMLIEKAFAKQYGRNYFRIELGFSLDALKDLTGAPAEYIDLKDYNHAFSLIQDSLEKGFVLTVSSKPSAQETNVVSRHCYGILNIKSIVQPGNQPKTFKLVKLRNPYGNLNYVHTNVPDYVINKIGEPMIQNGGVFWMKLEDFVKDFEVVTVCKLFQNYVHSFIKIKKDLMMYGGQTAIIEIHVPRQTHCYFGIHQKHQRYYKTHPDDHLAYKVGRIIIAKLKGDIIDQVIDGAFSCQQSTFLEVLLQPGSYLLFTQLDGDDILKNRIINNKRVSSYGVSCYAQSPVAMQLVSEVQTENHQKTIADSVLYEMMLRYVKQNVPAKAEQWNKYLQKQANDGLVSRYHGTGFGHVFIYHNNDCSQNKFRDQMTFQNMKNLQPYSHELVENQICVELPPKTDSLILFRIENKDNCSHKLVFSNIPSFQTQLSWNDLKSKALAETQGKKRVKMNKEFNVFLHQYKYNGGVMLVWDNQTKQPYEEHVSFGTLENCFPYNSNDEAYQNKNILVNIAAGEKFAINLKIVNLKTSAFKYTLSYS